MARSSRLVRVPIRDAFDYLADLMRHHEWSLNDLVVEPLQQTTIGEGSRFRSSGRQLGVRMRNEVLVTAYDPPRRIEFESSGRGALFKHGFMFEEAAGGTLVTKSMEARRMPFPLSLLTPLTELVLRRRLAKDLERIAARLESRA